jgi:hypothetical protein
MGVRELFSSGEGICTDKKLFSIIIRNNKERITKQHFYLKQICFGWFLALGVSREGYVNHFDCGKFCIQLPFVRIYIDWDWSDLYKEYGSYYERNYAD